MIKYFGQESVVFLLFKKKILSSVDLGKKPEDKPVAGKLYSFFSDAPQTLGNTYSLILVESGMQLQHRPTGIFPGYYW